ncbi:19992_t:CDS:1, partial [Funneliformis geosporum]
VSFQYVNMSTDDWSTFAHKTDTLLTSCQLATLENHKLKSKQALNFYWDLIQGCIIKAAKKCIPIYYSSQHSHNLRPKSLKKVYQQIRTAQKLEKLSKKAFISNRIHTHWSNIYNKTVKIAVALKFEFLPIAVHTLSAIYAIIPTIRSLVSTLS